VKAGSSDVIDMTDRSVILKHMTGTRPTRPTGAPSKPARSRRGEKTVSTDPSKTASPKRALIEPVSGRAARAAERRQAIIDAAMDEFVARGYAATRLDDVAQRAGVAKGTIYLHFKDKEALFQELIRTALVPLIGRLAAPPPAGGSVRAAIERFAQAFEQEVVSTRRGDIVRLVVAEGARFPSVAEFYYREVVSRGLAGMRALIELGIQRGEIRNEALARFPQIVVAPAIVAVIWQGLFGKQAPLDASEMFRVHLDLIFGERRTT
jgi:AcrR family transcriptional regulator